MDTIWLGSDNLLELLGPTDEASATAVNAPTSISAKLFDDRKDSRLTAAAAGAQPDIVVADASYYAPGDTLAVRLDTGSDDELVVQTISGSTITFTGNLSGAASAGARVAKKLGATITISTTPFGTPVAYDEDWGFRGTLPDDHADLEEGQRVRIEYDFNGGAGMRAQTVDHAQVLAPWLGEPPA